MNISPHRSAVFERDSLPQPGETVFTDENNKTLQYHHRFCVHGYFAIPTLCSGELTQQGLYRPLEDDSVRIIPDHDFQN